MIKQINEEWTIKKMQDMLNQGYHPVEVSMEKWMHDKRYGGTDDCALCNNNIDCKTCEFRLYSGFGCCQGFSFLGFKSMGAFMEVIYICWLLKNKIK